jgi:hypothetical protein
LYSFWASIAMNEEDVGGLAEESVEGGSLQDHMAHWAEVLDRWVRRVDRGMGSRVAGTKGQDGADVDDPLSSLDGGSDVSQDVMG